MKSVERDPDGKHYVPNPERFRAHHTEQPVESIRGEHVVLEEP
jgi:hypothetical protein